MTSSEGYGLSTAGSVLVYWVSECLKLDIYIYINKKYIYIYI